MVYNSVMLQSYTVTFTEIAKIAINEAVCKCTKLYSHKNRKISNSHVSFARKTILNFLMQGKLRELIRNNYEVTK